MTPEDFDYFRNRTSKFISGTNRGIKFGSFGSPNIRKLSIIPKRSVPQQIVNKLSSASLGQNDGIETTKRDVSYFGKITLNLEQTKNNLERILQVIADDYKTSKETNQKEVDEYRKRIANRGRIFGKKELGDKKTDILGGVKKYVGSFFSGVGGSIRGLAAFNLLEAILSGDPTKIIGPLLGIGATYLPAIGAAVGVSVAKSLGKGLLGLGGSAAPAASAAAGAGSSLGKFGRFAGKAGLVAGGIGLASSLFNRSGGGEQTQQRLEDLTQQQKALVEPGNLVSIPQNDLRRFESLNNKFEKAIDFLLAKQKEGGGRRSSSSGGGPGPGPGPTGQLMTGPAPTEVNALMSAISGAEGGLESVNTIGTLPGLSQMTIDDAIAKVEQLKSQGKTSGAMGRMQQMSQFLRGRAVAAGLDPSTALFNEENQYKIDRAYLASLFSGGEQEIVNLIRSGKISTVVNKLKGVWPSLPGGSQENVHTSGFYRNFQSFLGQLSSAGPSPIQLPPMAPALPRRNIPSPASAAPTFVPMAVPQQTAPQQTSAASGVNDQVPAFSTTYSENFLTLYSKLIYQVV
jgi:muramidase (phage lysozyme)